jgi:hypothetical protein
VAAAFFAIAFSLAGQGCESGTEVQDPAELRGRVDLDNGRPASGALVMAVPSVKHAAKTGRASTDIVIAETRKIDTVLADAKGEYHFDSLPTGQYDLMFEDATDELREKKRGRIAEVKTVDNGRVVLNPITLKRSAQLLATVADFFDRTPIDSARCEVEGTPYKEFSDKGVVYFYLPEGAYTVMCRKNGYAAATTQVEMYAEPGKPLQDKVIEFRMDQGEGETSQPVPADVTAAYDKATGVVTLSWSKVNYSQLFMYGIRRVDSAIAGAPTQFTTTDTILRDVVYLGQTDTVPQKTLRYFVYSLKKDLIFRTPSQAVRVEATRPTAYGADVSLWVIDPKSPYSVGDTIKMAGSYHNAFRDNTLLRWRLKDSKDSLRDVGLAGRSGADTLFFPCKTAGKIELGIEVTDVNGVVSSKYKGLEIIPAP